MSFLRQEAIKCLYTAMTQDQKNNFVLVQRVLQGLKTVHDVISVMTDLQADVDSPDYITIKHYLVWLQDMDQDDDDEEISSTSSLSPTELFQQPDVVPDNWLSPKGQLLRKGVVLSSPEGRLFLERSQMAAQLAATTHIEQNRPILSSGYHANVLKYTETFRSYSLKGHCSFFDGIDPVARDEISVDLLAARTPIDWEGDELEGIQLVLDLPSIVDPLLAK